MLHLPNNSGLLCGIFLKPSLGLTISCTHTVQFCSDLLSLGFCSCLVVGLAPGSLDWRKQFPTLGLTVVLARMLSSGLEATSTHPGTRSPGGDQDNSSFDLGPAVRYKRR